MRNTDPLAFATDPGDEVYAVKRTNSLTGEEYVRVGVRTYGAGGPDVLALDLLRTDQAVDLMTDLCAVIDSMWQPLPERAS